MLTFLYAIGFQGISVMAKIQSETSNSWTDLILGPLGALALSVAGLYFMWNYMRKKDDLIRKIREDQLADKEKQIQELKNEISKLKKQE